jgi:hypothetical protein
MNAEFFQSGLQISVGNKAMHQALAGRADSNNPRSAGRHRTLLD